MMTAEQALQWLAELPEDVRLAYLGPNPAQGGYACILYQGNKPWWRGGGPERIIEGNSEWDDEDSTGKLGLILGALQSARDHLGRPYHRRFYP